MTGEGTAGGLLSVDIPPGIQLHGVDQVAGAQFLLALGAVVRASSHLEFVLRSVFCELEDGPNAAVVATGQGADWLLGMNAALAKHRTDIPNDDRDQLGALLSRARSATQDRNRFVHDVWGGSPDGPLLGRSQRRIASMTNRPLALAEVVVTAHALHSCSTDLVDWATHVLSSRHPGQ
jgi:hypothetical protein